MRSQRVDIVGIVETKVKEVKAHNMIKRISKDSHFFTISSESSQEIIWVLWNPFSVGVTEMEKNDQIITCLCSSLKLNKTFTFTLVYASYSAVERRQLWLDL